LVRQAAQALNTGWDIEIIEAHHWRKVDAHVRASVRNISVISLGS
jgi:dihydrodipicolinate reductase